ncbi:uncharacterized protein [Nicotiana tomentosiformis]|uniref:uncharacterized protein n=1 Tax=Nicotiana tomentosiformis TaxID=4098 RepID=UPI00388CA40D
MMKKDAATSWTEDCQKAFDKIKEYLSTPPVLVPPEPGRPLLLYLSVLDGALGCVLGQHDETRRKEQAIYYLSKKFTPYEARSAGTSGAGRMGYKEYQDITISISCARDDEEHPNKNFINHVPVRIHNRLVYCAHIEEETDGNPWFRDIREYLAKREYPEHTNHSQKRILWRLSNNFFISGGILYRRTPDLGLLRCVDAKEASKLLEEIHAGTCGPHMNGFVLAKKILRAGYFWMTMETNCIRIKVVIPAEVEIRSLTIIQEDELSDAEWIKSRYEQLALIDEKRMNADEAKGKFSPNWQGPYMVHMVLTRGVLILAEMDGEIWPKPINSDAVKRYYV